MLDTSLTWELAKEQCGVGEEEKDIIAPTDDAALAAGLWDAYRQHFPQIQHSPDLLLSFITQETLAPQIDDCEARNMENKSRNDSKLLWEYLSQTFDQKSGPLYDYDSDEILRNALCIGIRESLPTTVRYYAGPRGGAFAAENKSSGLTHEEILGKSRNTNKGKGWPFMLAQNNVRVGIESGELFRVIAVETKADLQQLFLPHASNQPLPNEAALPTINARYVVNGQKVWTEYIAPNLQALEKKWQLPTGHMDRLHTTQRLSNTEGKALLDQHKNAAWERVREALLP